MEYYVNRLPISIRCTDLGHAMVRWRIFQWIKKDRSKVDTFSDVGDKDIYEHKPTIKILMY